MTEHAQLDAAVSQDDQGYLARCDCYYLLSIDRGIYFMSNVFHLHSNEMIQNYISGISLVVQRLQLQ